MMSTLMISTLFCCELRRNDYELNLSVNQHYLENVRAELLRDGHGGLLVYSATEDQYSSTGKFDANWAARERFGASEFGGTRYPAGSTTNLRATALLNRATDPNRFSHQRPSSANAALLRTSVGTGTLGAVALANTLQARRTVSNNVWATLDLGRNENADRRYSAQSGQQTQSFKTATDFGQMDQTALSFDDGAMVLENFATLQNAFSSANAEDAIALSGSVQDFASPFYDTEVLLEMASNQHQVR
jgi:hypothetical protein